MNVGNMFTVDELVSAIDDGWVRVQSNADKTLFIYNYTEKAQFDKHWNPVTLNCRGLILDEYMSIVARPWKKFFNYGEGRLYIDDVMPVQVTDKMDGSLGILYSRGDHEWAIATRGSFNSDQALHASVVLNQRYTEVCDYLRSLKEVEHTFLFEIIYPKNRIVLNYGELDDLVLLGAVHNEQGYYVGPQEAAGLLNWTGPMTQTFDYKNMAQAFAAPMRPNAEGLVVRSGTEMVKIKQVDYVELHRIVTNLNERTIWARMAKGETLAQMAEYVPDEWHEFLNDTSAVLIKAYRDHEDDVFDHWQRVAFLPKDDRKRFASAASKSKYAKYLFLLFDSKPIDQLIWADIKPCIDKE